MSDYRVKKGDSYWNIAKALYGGSEADINANRKRLQKENGGQRLFDGTNLKTWSKDAKVNAMKDYVKGSVDPRAGGSGSSNPGPSAKKPSGAITKKASPADKRAPSAGAANGRAKATEYQQNRSKNGLNIVDGYNKANDAVRKWTTEQSDRATKATQDNIKGRQKAANSSRTAADEKKALNVRVADAAKRRAAEESQKRSVQNMQTQQRGRQR